jgi:hypothetical protein
MADVGQRIDKLVAGGQISRKIADEALEFFQRSKAEYSTTLFITLAVIAMSGFAFGYSLLNHAGRFTISELGEPAFCPAPSHTGDDRSSVTPSLSIPLTRWRSCEFLTH